MLLAVTLPSGCTTLHRDTGALLPPQQSAQVHLRINEARQAEQQARDACAKLRASLIAGKSGRDLAFDLDRLDAAASEFDRRAACISDVAVRTRDTGTPRDETARLQRRSREMLTLAASLRHASPDAALAMLDALR